MKVKLVRGTGSRGFDIQTALDVVALFNLRYILVVYGVFLDSARLLHANRRGVTSSHPAVVFHGLIIFRCNSC